MTAFSGLPLVICGVLKIGYDLALLYSFRHIKPPEEASWAPPLVPRPARCRAGQFCATAVLSSAARNPCASFRASSLAQKWTKNMRGCSSSM